jgi:hypothetical protein
MAWGEMEKNAFGDVLVPVDYFETFQTQGQQRGNRLISPTVMVQRGGGVPQLLPKADPFLFRNGFPTSPPALSRRHLLPRPWA